MGILIISLVALLRTVLVLLSGVPVLLGNCSLLILEALAAVGLLLGLGSIMPLGILLLYDIRSRLTVVLSRRKASSVAVLRSLLTVRARASSLTVLGTAVSGSRSPVALGTCAVTAITEASSLAVLRACRAGISALRLCRSLGLRGLSLCLLGLRLTLTLLPGLCLCLLLLSQLLGSLTLTLDAECLLLTLSLLILTLFLVQLTKRLYPCRSRRQRTSVGGLSLGRLLSCLLTALRLIRKAIAERMILMIYGIL